MLHNYLKVAIRNLVRQKLYSAITILGLAVGIGGCLLISLYVTDELSYDRYHQQAEQVYRVVVQESPTEGGALTSAPFAAALKQEYSEVKQAVRINEEGGGPISYGRNKLIADDIFFADAGFFDLFTCQFIAGNPKTALTEPNTIILTRNLAEKLFGNVEAATGKTVLFNHIFPNTVVGVIEDIPKNTHLRFSGLRALPKDFTDGWWSMELYTYVLLPKGYDAAKLEAKLPGFYRKYLATDKNNENGSLKLQPLPSIHLHSHLGQEISANSDIAYVYIFSAIALLVLVIACINYMNLATARSAGRAKEVGIRKVVGSGREQLIGQFLAESTLMVLLSLVLAIGFTHVALPFFNDFTGKELSISFTLPAIGGTLLAVLVLGIISGGYPALFLSRFRPVAVLKGTFTHQPSGIFFRKSLVVFQFAISVIMISSTWIINEQLHYMNQKDLGFNKEQLLSLHIHEQEARPKVAVIKEQFLKNSNVLSVAAVSNPIGNNTISTGGFYFEENGQMPTYTKLAQRFMVDTDFLSTMGIKLLQGRNFSPNIHSDSAHAVLVNETLVKTMGWKEPIGKRVAYFIDNYGKTEEARIIGVVKDFHIYSLQHAIEPLVLRLAPPYEQDNLYIRIRPENVAATLAFLQKTYHPFDANNAFEASFLDQNFARQYQAEGRRGQVFLAFAVFAIFIACLGLFGLAAFTAEQRTKEIGIRKVLGASVNSILLLLSKDFLKLVGVAFVIAVPVSWYLMHRWLQDFAYRITPGWTTFLLAGLLAVGIALLTVGYQSIKAALTNPVKSLRSE